MVDDRWGDNELVVKEEPPFTSSFTSFTNNGTRPLPVLQNRIPKLSKPTIDTASIPKEQDLADRDKLRGQLTSLQALLEKTSKKGGDILRSFRGRDLNQHPAYAENLKLQQDVEKRIEEVKGKLFEISKRIGASSKEVKPDDELANQEPVDVAIKPFANVPLIEDEDDFCDKNFIDPGMHWCKQCDTFISDLPNYLKHLTTEKHWKSSETKEEPWRRSDNRLKIEVDPEKKRNEEIKGVHTLVAIRGYYCQVCGVLLGSPSHAEDHLKTNRHNRCYTRQKLMNGQHEYNYSIDKSRALTKFQSQERKRQKEQEEKDEREREAKKRATETEMKKRILKEKMDEENRLKKSRESQEKKTQEARSAKEIGRNRDRERERHKDKDRDRDKERSSKGCSSKLYHNKEKDQRSKDKDRDPCKFKSSDDVKSEVKGESSTIIERIADEEVYGPHFPFHDRKLAMKPIVVITNKEWQLCYKKHIKLMMRGKSLSTLSKSTTSKSEEDKKVEKPQLNNESESKSNTIQSETTPEIGYEKLDNVDSSIGDLVLAITSDRGGGMSDSKLDHYETQSNQSRDMFTVEFDDEDDKSCKSKSSCDFVVTQDIDFSKICSSINNNIDDGTNSCDNHHSFEIGALGEDDRMEMENGINVFFSDARKPSPEQTMEDNEVDNDPFKMNDEQLPNGTATIETVEQSLTSPTDEQMLSPPIWAQPLSLHDLVD